MGSYMEIFEARVLGGNLSFRRKPEDPAKTTDKLYHIMLYRVHLAMSGIPIYNFIDDMH
jgi:hypothetical protein